MDTGGTSNGFCPSCLMPWAEKWSFLNFMLPHSQMVHKNSIKFTELSAEQHALLRMTQTDDLCCILGLSLWVEQQLPTTLRERLLPWLSWWPAGLAAGSWDVRQAVHSLWQHTHSTWQTPTPQRSRLLPFSRETRCLQHWCSTSSFHAALGFRNASCSLT